MNKILLSLLVLLFSSAVVLSEEKRQCTKLVFGQEYIKCLKNKVTSIGYPKEGAVKDKSGKNWYQKIKNGKPLLSK